MRRKENKKERLLEKMALWLIPISVMLMILGLLTILMEAKEVFGRIGVSNQMIINMTSAICVISGMLATGRMVYLLVGAEGAVKLGTSLGATGIGCDKKERLEMFAKSLEHLSQSIEEIACDDKRSDYLKKVAMPPKLNTTENQIENEIERITDIYKFKVDESRRAVAAQLKDMAKMLADFSSEDYDLETINKEKEAYIKTRLRGRGVHLKRIVLLKNRRGILEVLVTVKGTRGKLVGVSEMEGIIEEALEERLKLVSDGRKYVSFETTTYDFVKEPNFMVLQGSARVAKGSERVCGDNFAFLELRDGQTLMSLSDGMGSGLSAYKESELVIELLEELLTCGFSEEVSLRLINSVLFVGVKNSNPATVDMSMIDTYSGVCDFIKSGAATTFIKRGKWIEAIKSTSMPIGVFDAPDMESVSKKLYDGDFVIMVSDGVIDGIRGVGKEERLCNIIANLKTQTPNEMAKTILDEVIKISGDIPKDDMTVLVMGIWERKICTRVA